ncbi:hypothetical protein UlMin_016311 [Ulmus minor]
MGSLPEHKIPVIDFTNKNLKPGTDSWMLACKQVRHALEEYGCFEVVYDKVPIELHNSIFASMKDLFDLPLETRMQKTSDKPYHSYLGQFPIIPRYENLGMENPTTQEGAQNFAYVMWPAGGNHSYGVVRLYESYIASTSYLLRFIKYRRSQTNESELGIMGHTDKTFFSILHQRQKGLEVKTKDGHWIALKPSPSSFVFLAGDILQAWSNDRVRAGEHQVIIKEAEERYSLGFFSFINREHPLRYKSIDHFNFLLFNQTEEGRKSTFPIKVFCGV